MTGYEFILQKQLQWAYNNDLGDKLIGSAVVRGRQIYTKELEFNLFQPLLEDVQDNFSLADGNEIIEDEGHAAKMSALHSSSALCVNVFQYWLRTNRLNEIAYMCGLCDESNEYIESMQFEKRLSIQKRFPRCPNIDVVIENNTDAKIKAYAIESKFSEPYSNRGHGGLNPKYLQDEEVWSDIPKILELSKDISPDDKQFKYLHAAQLIKHILALKKNYGGKTNFRLLYIWYDTIGDESFRHGDEIARFFEITKQDNILFHSLTYQELIVRMANRFRESDKEYIEYITGRYL